VSDPASTQGRNAAQLTFRGGGWILLLAAVLVVLLLFWSLLGPMLGHRPTGDGRTLESYRFDLSTLLIPRDSLQPSGNPRGFLPSLDAPSHLRGAEMTVYNEQNRPKYVVTSDRVLGIVIAGQAHAWPLSMLNVHEVVNDTVAGVPVAATYSPLCDTAIVFDRVVDGQARNFEVSGLLVDSNLVFYDKAPPANPAGEKGTDGKSGLDGSASTHVPSLFLQLERRAVAGPLAAKQVALNVLPGACITTWADWIATHPDTTVTLRDPQAIRRMKEISYARYFLTPTLEFPATPLPDADALAAAGLRLKSPMVAFELGSDWRMVSLESLAAKAAGAPVLEWSCNGVALRATLPAGPSVIRLERVDGTAMRTIPCLCFAAEAVVRPFHPITLVQP
jgi:hypothetical protein